MLRTVRNVVVARIPSRDILCFEVQVYGGIVKNHVISVHTKSKIQCIYRCDCVLSVLCWAGPLADTM